MSARRVSREGREREPCSAGTMRLYAPADIRGERKDSRVDEGEVGMYIYIPIYARARTSGLRRRRGLCWVYIEGIVGCGSLSAASFLVSQVNHRGLMRVLYSGFKRARFHGYLLP